MDVCTIVCVCVCVCVAYNCVFAFIYMLILMFILIFILMFTCLCVKGYLRKGAALQMLGRYKEQILAYKVALKHNPQNSELQALLEQAKARQRKHKKRKKKTKKSAHAAMSNLNTVVSNQMMRETMDALRLEP